MKKIVIEDGFNYLTTLGSKLKKPIGGFFTGKWAKNTTFKQVPRDLTKAEDFIDIEKIDAAYEKEGYFRRVCNRITELFFKRKYVIKSRSKRNAKLIKTKINEIEEYSGKSFILILSEILLDLLKYGNAFVYKYRTLTKPTIGRSWNKGSKKEKPIIALFPLSASDVIFDINNKKTKDVIKRFAIKSNTGETLTMPVESVIHFKVYAGAGELLGNPAVGPSIGDIISLRRIEENMELLVFNYAIPFFHVIIGDPDHPVNKADELITKSTIEDMPMNGIFVSDYSTKVEAVSSRNATIDIQPIAEHFKKRILATLASSLVEMGESDTTNKSTSLTVSRITQDVAKYYQMIIEEFLNFLFMKPLMHELKIDTTDDNKKVTFVFPEIDLDELLALENMDLLLFNSNVITFEEVRQQLGYNPMTPSEIERTKFNLFPGKSKETTPQISNNVTPENQNGKKSTKSEPVNK